MNEIRKRTKVLKQERNCRRKKATTVLKACGFANCKFIGAGSFGDVIRCKDLDNRCKVSVKVVATEVSSWGERTAWQHFNHLNIVPLLAIIRSVNFDLFVMPFYCKTLDGHLKNKRFHKKRSAYDISRGWLNDILNGLEYLHRTSACHLDLKTDNILVTSERIAVICDFTFTSSRNSPIQRYGLPYYYRPPETCIFSARSLNIDGAAFDVWSFGIVALYLCTGKWLKHHILTYEYNWHEYVYPVLFRCLQLQMFGKLLRSTFPYAPISDKQILEALNLIQATLRYKPTDRPGVARLLNHSMVTKHLETALLETDRIWTET